MSALIPAIARGGTRVDPSVVRHVLQLVSTEYMPGPSFSSKLRGLGSQIQRYHSLGSYGSRSVTAILPTHTRSRLSPGIITASRPVRRHAAAAQAIEEDLDDHHHYNSPPADSNNDVEERRSRLPRRTEHVAPTWTELPAEVSERLGSEHDTTAGDFQQLFEKAHCQPGQLARLPTLGAILSIYLKGAEPSQWAWLSGQLGHMLEVVANADLADFHHDLSDFGHMIRAYGLAELGQTNEARASMESKRTRSNMAAVHALEALVLHKLGQPADARRQMTRAIRRGVTRSGYWMTKAMTNCVERYTQEASEEDVLAVMPKGGDDFLRLFLDKTRQKNGEHDRLIKIWTDWLAIAPVSVTMADLSFKGKQVQRIHFPILAKARDRARDALDLFIHMKQTRQFRHVSTSDAIALFRNFIAIDQVQAAMFVFHEIRQIRTLTHERLSPFIYHLSTANVDVRDHIEEMWTMLNEVAEPTFADCRAVAIVRAKAGDLEGTRAAYAGLTDTDAKVNNRRRRHLLEAAVQGGHIDEAVQCLEQVMEFEPAVQPFNQVQEMLLRFNADDRAIEVYDQYRSNSEFEYDSHTFTSLIAMYARRRDPQGAETVLQDMLERGLEPDAATTSAMLNAYVESGDWNGVERYWESISEEMKRADSVVSTALKAMVLRSAPLSGVLAMFRSTERPTAYHWSMVLQSASDNGNLEATEALFAEMQHASEHSLEAVKPDVHAWSILLHANLRANNLKRTQAMYDDMLASGIVPSSVTYSMIIQSYAASGRPDSLQRAEDFAMAIYRMTSDSDTQSRITEKKGSRGQANENLLSPLVMAAGEGRQPELASEYFDLVAKKEKPSITLYTQYLNVWRKAQDSHMVKLIWAEIFALACRTTKMLAPDRTRRNSTTRVPENTLCVPLSVVLITFGKEKRLLDIKETWNAVRAAGFGFDAGNFNHLAVSLAHSGDVEGAFDIVENVLLASAEEVEPEVAQTSIPHATEPAFRPPNRRRETSARNTAHNQPDFTNEALGQLASSADKEVPWKPHRKTIATLDTLVSQLETAESNRAWLGLMSEEAEAEEEVDGEGTVVMLHTFDNCVRDPDTGKPKKTSAKGLLMKLNRKYAKAMALVMFHRKKQAGARQKFTSRAAR